MITAPERPLAQHPWARRAIGLLIGQGLPERNWGARGGNISLLGAGDAGNSAPPRPHVPGFLQRPIGGTHPYVLLETIPAAGRTGRDRPTIVVAIGVRSSGHREVLGADVTQEVDTAFWLGFLRSLHRRGLAGVRLVTADDHPGLQLALRAVLPTAAWQRCLTHLMRDAVEGLPASGRQFATAAVRRVFAQPDREAARRAIARVTRRVARRNPRLAGLLHQADPACLTYYSFPAEHRQQIWSTNTERLRGELARRFALLDTTTDRESLLQLVVSVLEQQDAGWRGAGPYCRTGAEPPAKARQMPNPFRRTSLTSARRVLVGAAS